MQPPLSKGSGPTSVLARLWQRRYFAGPEQDTSRHQAARGLLAPARHDPTILMGCALIGCLLAAAACHWYEVRQLEIAIQQQAGGVAVDPGESRKVGRTSSDEKTSGFLQGLASLNPFASKPRPLSASIALRGIILSDHDRPLAMINDIILEPGERAGVRIEKKEVGFECVQISSQSVVLQTDDGREVTLRMPAE